MNTVIIETIVSVLANLAITLIGVAGAWLVTQIGKSQHLNAGSPLYTIPFRNSMSFGDSKSKPANFSISGLDTIVSFAECSSRPE